MPRAQARGTQRRGGPGQRGPNSGRRGREPAALKSAPAPSVPLPCAPPDPHGPEADPCALPFYSGRRGPERAVTRPRTQSRRSEEVRRSLGPASAALPPPLCPRDGGHASPRRRPPPRLPRSVHSPRPQELVHKSSFSTSSAQACLLGGRFGWACWVFRECDGSSNACFPRLPGSQGQGYAGPPPARGRASPALGLRVSGGDVGHRQPQYRVLGAPMGVAVGTRRRLLTQPAGHHVPDSLLSLEGVTALPHCDGQWARGRLTVPQKHGGRGWTARPSRAPSRPT